MKTQSNQRELLKVKADTLNDAEIEEVLDYINIMKTLGAPSRGAERFDEAASKFLCRMLSRNLQGRVIQ